jgi:predicted ATPase/class 3 adenylate cyclase
MAELPSGTVTFLLTDVEGSTALWEEAPEAMHVALARHDAIFESLVGDHHGVHIRPRGEGDSRFAVFPSASDAVAAALAIQRAFAAESWPTPRPIKVRIGIHTGEAELRDGDYYGSVVNRCARLREVGHGGQVLLSKATAGLVGGALAPGAHLRDLAEHQLRGFEGTERVFQLVHPELPADFPPLVGAHRRTHNLPAPTTSLIGRDEDVDYVRNLLRRDDVRIVTITGAGGVGKSRLGLQVAANLLDCFADGVFFVELAPISEPDLVLSTIAHVLGLREAGGCSLRETVKGYLTEKHLLLLLDNFEHLLPSASLVADLLASCPELKVLATSRAVLHLRGEREYAVPPLPCPDPERLPPVAALVGYGAVALFVQRAVDSRAEFALTEENALAVAEVCRRLDGIPLAIELAAAQVGVLAPKQIAARVDDRFRLLTGGDRAALPRHRTVRALLDWSYDLLSQPERVLLRRLAVFARGWTLEAADDICAGHGVAPEGILDLLAQLVQQSLVITDDHDGAVRYRFLETIRAYGLDRLAEHGEADGTRRRHADFFLRLAETAEPELWGLEQGPWAERLEREHENIKAALRWALDHKEAAVALRLSGAMARFWAVRGYLLDGQRWLSAALELERDGRDAARAKALNGAGNLARDQGSYDAAIRFHSEALQLWQRAGGAAGVAVSFHNLGVAERDRGDRVAARAHLEQSLRMFRDLGDHGRAGLAVLNLGKLAHDTGDEEVSERLFKESLEIFLSVGNAQAIATSLNRLGDLARTRGEWNAARDLHEQSLGLHRERGDAWGIAVSLNYLARVALAEADVERAETLSLESLALLRDVGARPDIAIASESLAVVAYRRADPIRAVRLLSAATRLRDTIGTQAAPADRAGLERVLAAVRVQVGSGKFDAAWAEGRAMTLEQAIAYALDEQGSA